jgi:hypothetical protein
MVGRAGEKYIISDFLDLGICPFIFHPLLSTYMTAFPLDSSNIVVPLISGNDLRFGLDLGLRPENSFDLPDLAGRP